MPEDVINEPIINTYAGREPEVKEPANITIGPKEGTEEVKDAPKEQEPIEEPNPENIEGNEPKATEDAPKKRPGRYQKRIDRLTAKTSTLEQQNAALLAELAKARTSPVTKTEQNAISQPEIEALTVKKAEELIAIREFNDKCNDIAKKGEKAFEDFNESVEALREIGIMKPDFLSLVLELDAPEKVLHHLGQDVEEAEEIYALSPAKRAIALTKLEAKLEAKSVKEVSKAPPPPKTVEAKSADAGSSYGSKYYEGMPMDEFVAWDNKQKKQRN